MKSIKTLLIVYNLIAISSGTKFCNDFWSLRVKKSINIVKFKSLNPFLRSSDQIFNDDSKGEVMSIHKDKIVVLEPGPFYGRAVQMNKMISKAEGKDCNTFLLLPNLLTVCTAKVHHFRADKSLKLVKTYDEKYLPLNILSHRKSETDVWQVKVLQEIDPYFIATITMKIDLKEDSNAVMLGHTAENKKVTNPNFAMTRWYFTSDNLGIKSSPETDLNLNPLLTALPFGYEVPKTKSIMIYDIMNKKIYNMSEKETDKYNIVIHDLLDKKCDIGQNSNYERYNHRASDDSEHGGNMLYYILFVVLLLMAIVLLVVIINKKAGVTYKYKANTTNSTDIVLPTADQIKTEIGKHKSSIQAPPKNPIDSLSVKSTVKSTVKSAIQSTVKSPVRSAIKSTVKDEPSVKRSAIKSSIQKG